MGQYTNLPFLNRKRLHVYPFLVLIAVLTITLINAIFSNGWYGRIGGFIGYDFLSFYSGGKLYWTDISKLYNQDTLAILQNHLVGIPTSGMNYYPYPPYTGMVFGLLSFLPYTIAYIVWLVLSVVCLVASAWLVHRYLIPQDLKEKGVSLPYLMVLIFSFYPVIFGLQNGQTNSITLLLLTMITIFTIKRRHVMAGVCAALLLYKPQLAIGWLVLWLLLKNYKALLAFVLTGSLWVGVTFLHQGFSPYLDYWHYLPQVAGIYPGGHVWEVTPIAIIDRLMIFLFGSTSLFLIYLVVVISLTMGMIYLIRMKPYSLYPALLLVLLFPVFSFHSLYYNLVLLIPLFALWSQFSQSRIILLTIIGTYIAALILPAISELVNFPLMGFLPLLILLAIRIDLWSKSPLLNNNSSPTV